MQMRGLHHMINTNVKKKKDDENEKELVREPWMNKKREEMTDEQVKLFLEFQRKEMELREQKEKIRSQNLTKLNFHKSEIENNQIDLDMKFAKILRKKLHYDTLISEQEIYILSLMGLLKKRDIMKKQKIKYEKELKELQDNENKQKEIKENFEKSMEKLNEYLPEEDKEKERQKPPENVKANANIELNDYLKKVQNDPYFFFDKLRHENQKIFGDKDFREFQINPELNAKNQAQQNELKNYFDKKYYFDYKKKQFEKHKNYLDNEYIISNDKTRQLKEYYDAFLNDIEKLKLDFSLMVIMKRGQDEVIDQTFMEKKEDNNLNNLLTEKEENSNDDEDNKSENESEDKKEENKEENLETPVVDEFTQQTQEELNSTLGIPIENSLLVDINNINDLNQEIQESFNKKMSAQKLNKDHTQMKQYLTLENELLQVLSMDITLKMKYLKLTRVTKKIQEVVTGKEEINQAQIAKLYEDKKRNLEENTQKRIATLDQKLREIRSDIRKKEEENNAFAIKLRNLTDDVEKTKQIIELDSQIDGENYGEDGKKKGIGNKSLEIAEVSKLKAIVKNYYEEIEYLRAELDKLRARTFPSFLQKPDNVIYPDEK